MSAMNRRIWVLINYICLGLLLFAFYSGELVERTTIIYAALAFALIVGLISFFLVHINTGLWKLVHSKIDKLDERQVQVTHGALRHSYSIFTILALVILLIIALSGGYDDANIIMIFASLLYLAHTLPSSVLAWTEKEV
ncbi:MAG: hypothetical protein CVT49_09565 [candidate division Zixibacteria bacterium HGW-Zixibacteria-1]|nr:MAG: hypothetical protein CVT49_09565 [candidate division Zixibacteria bacterium HGW-Zixibacteria-1]